jgi:hypothetical protein
VRTSASIKAPFGDCFYIGERRAAEKPASPACGGSGLLLTPYAAPGKSQWEKSDIFCPFKISLLETMG